MLLPRFYSVGESGALIGLPDEGVLGTLEGVGREPIREIAANRRPVWSVERCSGV